MKTRTIVFIIIAIACLASVASAAPQKVNFQGKLTNAAGAPVNGSVSMTFRIYDVASGGTALWTETQTVTVTNGIYNVLLGKSNPIDTELTETKPLWLGVKVGADAEMSPRTELTPGAYDLIILNAITIKNGNVGIGTTNPVSTLDVTGGSGLWVRSGTGGSLNSSAGSGIRILQGSNGSHHIFAFNYNTSKAEDLNLQRPGGKVGIGTTNPVANLDINGGLGLWIRSSTGYAPLDSSAGKGIRMSQNSDGSNHIFAYDYTISQGMNLTLQGFGGNLGIGTSNPQFKLDVAGTLRVSGQDIAEPFDMTDISSLELGDVMVIDPHNPLHVTKSTTAYDTTVAGIVSSTEQAGYVAGSRSDGSSDKPIALVGRVLCNVSTENGAIKIGDLLTTSNTPGYAMKAKDFEKRQGAVLGKALQAFDEDNGQILVLVTLQ